MMKVKHSDLVEVIFPFYFNARKTLTILGRTGIGKSENIRDFAVSKAKELNKEFIDMKDIDNEKMSEVLKNPDKYFVLKILSMSTIGDPTDLKGLPFAEQERKVVRWLKNEWILVFGKCHGLLFLDELNLAPPSIQAIVYQVLLDKRIEDFKFGDGVNVFAAGNLSEDKAGTYELAQPIRTRGGVFELDKPTQESFNEWGLQHGISSWILTYLEKFPSRLFVESEKSDDIITPRSWAMVSDLIKDQTDLQNIKLLVGGFLGEGGASEFVAYIRLADKVPKPEQILSGKAKMPTEIDLKYACIAQIIEYYRAHEKTQNEIIKQIVELDTKVDAEFYMKMVRMAKGVNPKPIAKLINESKAKQLMKYSRYLL